MIWAARMRVKRPKKDNKRSAWTNKQNGLNMDFNIDKPWRFNSKQYGTAPHNTGNSDLKYRCNNKNFKFKHKSASWIRKRAAQTSKTGVAWFTRTIQNWHFDHEKWRGCFSQHYWRLYGFLEMCRHSSHRTGSWKIVQHIFQGIGMNWPFELT